MKPARLPLPEFVALAAMLTAVVAFSIDGMLPALPNIAQELSPHNVNTAQLVLTSFVLGMGIGTLVSGPLSDSYGRVTVITGGLVIYVAMGFWAMRAGSLQELLWVRVLQGIAAAAPRVVTVAMIRDMYEGRRMAQVVSFVMTVFVIFPSFAPAIGAGIISVTGTWRAIFGGFAVFGLVVLVWLSLRQRETLSVDNRRPLQPAAHWLALRDVLGNRLVMIYIAVMTLGFSTLFAFLSSLQQIYADTYGKGEVFHYYFLVTGLLSSVGTLVNASLVMRLGMRRLAIAAFGGQACLSLTILVLTVSGTMPAALAFPAFFFWGFTIFGMAGLTLGNLNALALQPMGHVAGMASSVVGAVSTIAALPIAVVTGLAFNGTPVPMLINSFVCSGVAFLLMRLAREMDPAPKLETDP